MLKRIAVGVLSGLILFAVVACAWIQLGIHGTGLPPVNERAYQQAIADYHDAS
jgi:hypothetical protein